MKKIILTFFLCLCLTTLKSQEAKNIADLDFLYQRIQNLSSYKDQLKNDPSYKQLYEKLRGEMKSTDDFEVYQKLLQLVYPINDNHLGFYPTPNEKVQFNYIKPKYTAAELEKKYRSAPKDSLEGIYYNYNGSMKYAIYPERKNVFYVHNLNTGLVEVILNRHKANNLEAIVFLKLSTPYVLWRNIRFTNGYFIGLNYKKDLTKNYSQLEVGENKYEYKKINDSIGYLRLSSFSAMDENIKIATEFFDKVRPEIKEKKLIVDLRNNGGGGYKTSRQFLNFLKSFNGKIYLLQNGYTVSNAEQFIANLKDEDNIITLGETTNGKIAYGSNMGETVKLPSQRFVFYPTDMPGLKRDTVYESVGIKPEVILNPFSEDWIQQTLTYIKAN